MTDITKCTGTDCPIKEKCYRYTAPSDPVCQSWMMSPWDDETEKCEEFWDRSKDFKDEEKKD